ncbi:Hg(II)-responsive transcriptional regulator [Ralstonia insidiosa]|uniref:Mercuric resistance operon regulatory protein n=1 Tax=Comamonas testosteroni TaxID=285 RepID=A0A096GZX0_COMTE|nr:MULTISPECIES: Hg(II)-responsive transcriptional regulator [Pseudomonadota]EBO5316982.1 Hg(II)-responsive transcriptional regulator [Salmonella enterica]HAU5618038.1 Hg(II)-responsive transcriptional regulator [Morganella morganii]HBN8097923.1 Hg(II)-responsive transcriptional regulator [Pseudomonas aeruginosa]HBX7861709.1 Hg(II)-responsive transcriptional regulator [Klebsiella pneumoniae]HDS1573287.1 Hg(II)-responsive transcriptional regulator [Stenotrophomonas maltophilia]
MGTELTIGKLADAAGVNIETIRYYQRRGLLGEPPKPPGGHRRYAPEQAKRVRFIKRGQALGFTLDEVAALLTLDAACACGETQELAVRKLGLIEQKMADLVAMQRVLEELVQQCDARDGHTTCPIIDVLAKD